LPGYVTVTSLKTVIKFWFLDPSSGFSLWFIVTQLETKNASREDWKREKGRQMEEKSTSAEGSKCES